jgi:hypothetical protein
MDRHGYEADVPLSAARATQSAMDWRPHGVRKDIGPLISGYHAHPVAVRKENGEHLIFDGHHRAVAAINAGHSHMKMHVIDAKRYDPANAGRPDSGRIPLRQGMTDEEMLAELRPERANGGSVTPYAAMMRDLEPYKGSNGLHNIGPTNVHIGHENGGQGKIARLHYLSSDDPGKGHASAALRHLTDLADKHGVTMRLGADAQGGDGLDSDGLEDWYGRRGFSPYKEDHEGVTHMERYTPSPRQARAPGGPVFTPHGTVEDHGRTLPETPHTLALQHQALLEGKKAAVMYPHNGHEPPPLPHGAAETATKDGVFHFNPAMISEEQIHAASDADRLNDILGLGPFNKNDVYQRIMQGEQPVSVISKDRHGHEAAAAWGTEQTAPNQMAALQGHMPEGGSVGVEHPLQTLQGRMARANGGSVQRKLFTGPIHSPVAGRTDHLPMHVPSGSYVIPADIVSKLGEGNTMAGFKHVRRMFAAAKRGVTHSEGVVPIVAAGGEYVLSPDEVMHAGLGDIDAGHRALDEFVKRSRKELIKTLTHLPGPKRD